MIIRSADISHIVQLEIGQLCARLGPVADLWRNRVVAAAEHGDGIIARLQLQRQLDRVACGGQCTLTCLLEAQRDRLAARRVLAAASALPHGVGILTRN